MQTKDWLPTITRQFPIGLRVRGSSTFTTYENRAYTYLCDHGGHGGRGYLRP